MKTTGIRILDNNDNVISPQLNDILQEISGGEAYKWSIIFFEWEGLIEGNTINWSEQVINDSPRGLFISWNELMNLAPKFFQIIDLVIIGCKNENLLRRYSTDQEMYEACDIVIVLFDTSYWEVFSKDAELIKRLAAKFKDIKYLEPDFQNE